MDFDLKLFGAGELTADLTDMAGRAADARPALRAVADDFLDIEGRLFASNGLGQWPPLHRRTVQAKARAGLDRRPMQATGRLRDSLTKRGAEGAVRRISAGAMTVGTTVHYARFNRNRPVLGGGEVDDRRWAEIVRHWVADGEVRRGIGL